MALKDINSNNIIKPPSKGEYLETILRSPQTVFSTEDVALMWREGRREKISNRLNKYVSSGKLVQLRRGLYAKDSQYNPLELATRIYMPSYVSFETVLTIAGINFQYNNSIYIASYVNRELKIGPQTIIYVRMKDYVLRDITGIDHTKGFATATPERAFLDRLYVSKDYHFDNLGGLDWPLVFEILPIYHNKRLARTVNEYHKHYRDLEGK